MDSRKCQTARVPRQSRGTFPVVKVQHRGPLRYAPRYVHWPRAVALASISLVAASLVLTSQASLTSRARLVELGGMGDIHLHAVLSPERGWDEPGPNLLGLAATPAVPQKFFLLLDRPLAFRRMSCPLRRP